MVLEKTLESPLDCKEALGSLLSVALNQTPGRDSQKAAGKIFTLERAEELCSQVNEGVREKENYDQPR